MEKNKMKILSKIIYIISQINMVLIGFAGLVIAIMMVATPILVSNTNVTKDKVKIFNEEFTYSIKKMEIKINDKVLDQEKYFGFENKLNLFEEGNELKTILVIEFVLSLALATLSLMYLALLNLYKLFKSVYSENTPFTESNIKYIKNIAKFIILSLLISSFAGNSIGIMIGTDGMIDVSIIEVLSVIVIYSLALMFEHGYKLQQEIDMTL